MNITSAVKGRILASISDVETVIDVINVFDAHAEAVERNRLQNRALADSGFELAGAKQEIAALRQRIAEFEAAAIFGAEVTDND